MMQYYSQHDEERVIVDFYASRQLKTGYLVDIGANDGSTFSNTARLIEMGWSAVMIEPHALAHEKCTLTYAGNPNVKCHNLAIGTTSGVMRLHAASDSMLSSLTDNTRHLWPHITWEDQQCKCMTWADYVREYKISQYFDFISIDAETMDYDILVQIDVTLTSLICIEHGENYDRIRKYLYAQGFSLIHKTQDNCIYARL